MNDLPTLDPQPLRDLLDLGAEAELVQELIALYEEDIPPRIQALREGLDAGDLTKILMEAHQMKGALSNLGLVRFADLAARIESEAKAGRLEASHALADAFPTAYDEALAALNQAFPKA